MTTRRLYLLLSTLLFVAVVALDTIFNQIDAKTLSENERKLLLEVFKSLTQFVVIILLGGVVASVFKAIESILNEEHKSQELFREQNRLRSEIRVDYLSRVGSAYRNAKNTRRQLRSVGLTTKFGEPPSTLNAEQLGAYKREMETLNSAQLELEALKIEAESLPALLGLQELPEYLRAMEGYLRKVVKEFERENARLTQGRKSSDFSDLKWLCRFTRSSSEGDPESFETNLATPHDQVIKLISKSTYHASKPN
jgi:hypothetical protein